MVRNYSFHYSHGKAADKQMVEPGERQCNVVEKNKAWGQTV